MRGRARDGLRALGVAALCLATWTGAALAAPVGVLRMTDGTSECVGPLDDGATFRYAYVNSIYLAPVAEELERRGGRMRLLRARSTDVRALEYFRWDGHIRHDRDGYVQDAPVHETDRLVIRVSPPYRQRIEGPGWSCDLAARFGDGVVTVTPEARPAAVAPR